MEEFLNSTEIEKLYEGLPNEIAAMIAPKLKEKYFIKNDYVYVLNKSTISYSKEPKVKEIIITATSELIETSYYKLSPETQELFKHKYKSNFKSIFQHKTVEKYLLPLQNKLLKYDVFIDLTLKEIHFKNGYIDLVDNVFKQRQTNKHFITKYINREYLKSSLEEQQKVLKYVNQIYPKEINRNCILRVFGSSLTGESIKDQTYLILIGQGSSGKSTMMEMTEEAFEIYVKSLKADALTQNNQKADKIFNTFGDAPYIRYIWINEPKDKKIDAEIFKQLVEGSIETTKLYQEGSHEQRHYAKLIPTMNSMLNIKIDSGTNRRIKAYRHTSLFVENKKDVNENENIYLKDKYLIDKLKQGNLLNAWVDILSKEASEWLKNPNIEYPPDFDETKNEIVSDNDTIGEFLLNFIAITKNEKDRIQKDKLYQFFKQKYPSSLISFKQLKTTLLNDKQIEFRRDAFELGVEDKRAENRGVFIGIKFIADDEISAEADKDYDYKIENLIEENNSLKRENEELKKQLAAVKEDRAKTNVKIKENDESIAVEPEVKPKKKSTFGNRSNTKGGKNATPSAIGKKIVLKEEDTAEVTKGEDLFNDF